jgi:hypothetical protein
MQGVIEILEKTSGALFNNEDLDDAFIEGKYQELKELAREFDRNQILRIQDNSSKTRLSILFYGFMWNALRIAEKTLQLVRIFKDPLKVKSRQARPEIGFEPSRT